jgi:ABC-type multidrug transport system fused ATPase/permease subunit
LHLNDATPFGEAFGDDMPPVSRAGMILDRATLEWRTIELQMSQEKFRSQAYTAMFSTDILKWLIDPRMEDRGTTDLAIHWSSLREQLAVPVTGIEGPGWMAKLDAAVAISIILRIENADLRERSDFAYGFLKNAFQIFPQLVIERDNIFALEALVAIAGFFVFSADKRTLAMLIAAAARMCHLSRLTLKRSGKKATMTVRKARVLLATYIIDQEASLNHGLPPSMEENEDDLDQLRQAGLEEILLIRYHLARVQSQINHRIYGSQVALENSQSRSMQELIVLLETCRMQIQDRETQLAGSSTPGLEGITNRILFYNCVNMVYWADDRRDTKQDTSLLWLTCPAPSASRRRCSKAARETLQIYTALSHVQYAELWSLCIQSNFVLIIALTFADRFFIPYLLSAYFTLAAIILERPECPDAIVDAGIINSFAQFLDYMIQKNGLDLHQMLAGCTRFAEVIRYVAANGAANGQDPAAGPASTFSSHTPNELDIKAQVSSAPGWSRKS